jgi:integrase
MRAQFEPKEVPHCGYSPMLGTVPTTDLLCQYLTSRDCGIRYRESLSRTVKKAASAGINSVADLQPPLVNKFLAGLSSLNATTKNNVRRELLTLWRYAFEEGMTDVPPLRVMKIRLRPPAPQAWPMHVMQSMLLNAEQDQTQVRHGMRICDWLPAWIVIAYDSGLRFSDIRNLRSDDIRGNVVVAVAQKTGKRAVRQLSGYAADAAARLVSRSPDGTLFAWFLTRRRAFLCIRAFLDRHHIAGSMKYLRRSCATYIEATRPGEATRYMQHSAPSVTARHYVDESLLAAPSGPPPMR